MFDLGVFHSSYTEECNNDDGSVEFPRWYCSVSYAALMQSVLNLHGSINKLLWSLAGFFVDVLFFYFFFEVKFLSALNQLDVVELTRFRKKFFSALNKNLVNLKSFKIYQLDSYHKHYDLVLSALMTLYRWNHVNASTFSLLFLLKSHDRT